MIKDVSATDAPDRSRLDFPQKVREAFAFLADAGFAEIETSSTLVRYRRDDVEVDVYHGRQSYEVGGGVTVSGTRYSMSEIVRAGDPEAARGYRNAVAISSEEVADGVRKLSVLFRRYGAQAIQGDRGYFPALEQQRKQWIEGFALDVLATQLRPQAEDAFRQGNYLMAATLYGRIRDRLSPAELEKLAVAEERSKG